MHTIQYVATRADSIDEAFRRVKSHLEEQMGDEYNQTTWYDWFVTGGGRWAKKDEAQYDDNYQDEVAQQGTFLFAEYLDKANSFRTHELDELLKESRKVDLQKVLENVTPNDFRGGMELYPIKKIYDLTMGIWDYNSYFYDTEHDSTNMIHMKNAIDKGDKNWYLVPVDFHF